MSAHPPFRRWLACLPVVVLMAMAAGSAQAQWAWKDDNGSVVFSDRPPPSSVKNDRIVRRPGSSPQPQSPAPSAQQSQDPQPAKTWMERDAEYKKRQAERAEAEKQAADNQRLAQQRQADCERARGYLATLESGIRVVQYDANGERVYMDDAKRSAELERAKAVMAQSCQ